jgi:hypothetical protein
MGARGALPRCAPLQPERRGKTSHRSIATPFLTLRRRPAAAAIARSDIRDLEPAASPTGARSSCTSAQRCGRRRRVARPIAARMQRPIAQPRPEHRIARMLTLWIDAHDDGRPGADGRHALVVEPAGRAEDGRCRDRGAA